MSMPNHARARSRMVEVQIARRGVRDRAVLKAMQQVPREAFLEPGSARFAYRDTALPIGAGQTISQPYIVAVMIEAAEVRPSDCVLEVGAGSGYAACVLSRIARKVYALERRAVLVNAARHRFETLGYGNVALRFGDGTCGWPEVAPFDAILVSAGAPEVPVALKRQLAVGGRLVIPVGTRRVQTLMKLVRTSENTYQEEACGAVAFVALVGAQGWPEDDGHS